MNPWTPPWEVLWTVLGWAVWLLVILGFLIIFTGVAYGFWQGVKKWFPPRK